MIINSGLLTLILFAITTVSGGLGSIFKVSGKTSSVLQWVMVLVAFGALGSAVHCFRHYYINGDALVQYGWRWFEIKTPQSILTVPWKIRLDSLSVLMIPVISAVSCFVHMYSIWYMHHDKNPVLFLFYVSLFTLLMLILVVSDNFLQLFLGWEGVGLCSYLLIGFRGTRPQSGMAANKAFIMNRVGDFGLIIGIALIYKIFGSVQFDAVFSVIAAKNPAPFMKPVIEAAYAKQLLGLTNLDIICLFLLLGCMGKSAQIVLHGWLPDAMEGPTPASSLIHAATMVTAGVFLIARCATLYDHSVIARDTVLFVGTVTALVTAIIAVSQNDIKKVIAYSTCSQLGYMFAACGAGRYGAAMFHLFTHAFFKSLLFLCAGVIIHAASGEQNMEKIGNTSKVIPFTKWVMIIASLSISGIVPFAGYFSKDAILETLYLHPEHGKYIATVLTFVAFLTSLYTWRIIFKVFAGSNYTKPDGHSHECLTTMVPLSLLAFMSVIAGYCGERYWKIWDVNNYEKWREALDPDRAVALFKLMHEIPAHIKIIPLCAAVLGIGIAYFPSKGRGVCCSEKSCILANSFDYLYKGIAHAVRSLSALHRWIDIKIVDTITSGTLIGLTNKGTATFAITNTAKLYHIAFATLSGIVVMFLFMLMMF